jgi:8-oxo-dGTP pyrophosphatase MutT (NUDIX family)
MKKRKVQSVIFYCDAKKRKHFLLLRVNKKRGLYWQNVTGGVDKYEKYKKAALREAIEETALNKKNIIEMLKTELVYEFHDRWGNDVVEKVFLIYCEDKWDVIIDPSEHCEHKWVREDKITKKSVEFATNNLALKEALDWKC